MDSGKLEVKPPKPQIMVKKIEEGCDSLQTQVLGIDKNMLVMIVIVCISIGVSFFLFKEIKKIREEVRTFKNKDDDEDLIEKVDLNSEAIKAIENKLDQLITALGSRDRAMTEARKAQQMAQAQQQQMPPQMQQMPPQVQAQIPIQLPTQPPPVQEQEHQNQRVESIPVMGGRLGGSSNSDIIML